MEEETKLKDYTKEEMLDLIMKQMEIYAIEDCNNIELTLLDCIKRTLDLRDLMKNTKVNFNKTKKIINKYAKDMKKENDIKKLFKNQNKELSMVECRYVVSVLDLMEILIIALNSEMFLNKLPLSLSGIEEYELKIEDLVIANGIVKTLKDFDSLTIDSDKVIRAVDIAIYEYLDCIKEQKNYRDEFDNSFIYVGFPENEEQEANNE